MAKGKKIAIAVVAACAVVAAAVAVWAFASGAIGGDRVQVSYVGADGTAISDKTMRAGEDATPPEAPVVEGKVFTGWDGSLTRVRGDETLTAQYYEPDGPCVAANTVYVSAGGSSGGTGSSDSGGSSDASGSSGSSGGTAAGKAVVSISLLKNPGLASLLFNVYADEGLTLENVEFCEGFADYSTAPEPYSNAQTISLLSPFDEITATGEFVRLTYSVDTEKLPEGANEASIHLVLDAESTFDSNLENVDLSTFDGRVKVIGI